MWLKRRLKPPPPLPASGNTGYLLQIGLVFSAFFLFFFAQQYLLMNLDTNLSNTNPDESLRAVSIPEEDSEAYSEDDTLPSPIQTNSISTITTTTKSPHAAPPLSKTPQPFSLVSHKENEELEDESNDDEPLETMSFPLRRNGCGFGWHSRSIDSPHCFHVSLVPKLVEDASLFCQSLGSTLVRIPNLEDNDFLCDVLNRANSRYEMPSQIHIGLVKNPFQTPPFRWRDGKRMNNTLKPLFPEPNPALPLTTTVLLNCKSMRAWTLESDAPFPFACGTSKPTKKKSHDDDAIVYEKDVNWNEESDAETLKWARIATFDPSDSCTGKLMVNQHFNPSLISLPEQISWKLSEYTPKSEPKRYFLVYQSKSWFGWLDFWTEYLTRYRDVHGAPTGKYVTSSRAAKEHLGWSHIFANPEVASKYQALFVFSRLPIPENVLFYFPAQTLVNQVYYDPLAKVPLGDKLELAFALEAFAEHLQCSSSLDLQVMPETFDIAKKCSTLWNRLRNNSSSSNWIIKGPQHGGAAITIMTSSQLLHKLQECTPAVLPKLEREHEIAQRMVENPLLLDGRKFDLRVFVLIASTEPLLVYVHREPYFRAAMQKYVSNALDANRHVTNTHVQKLSDGFSDKEWGEHIWTLERVKTLAHRAGLSEDFFSQAVFPQIKRSIQVVLASSAHTMVDRRRGQWKLFGVDFVIDREMRPYLLDWNAFPGWDWSYRLPWTLEYRRRILGDTWRLTLDIQRGKDIANVRTTPKSSGFELVFHSE